MARAAAAKTIQGILLAGAVALVWLWLQDGGISGVNGPAAGITSAGRLTGLLAGYLLVIQVLLLARLPFLEWIAGFDHQTRWHQLNGKVTLYFILAHVVLITIGYAMIRGTSILRESSLLLSQYYGIVPALIGTVMLIVVVGTSIVIVRRRLKYETWYLVHLLTYAGITLSWFHETRTGLDFVRNPWAAALWAGLYLVTLQLVLIFRFLQPIVRGFVHRMRVRDVISEAPGVTSVHIEGRNLDWFNARPGQFFLWRFLSPSRIWEAHPFSLSAAPTTDMFRISVKSAGDFTARMGQLQPGTPVIVEGPFGSVTDVSPTRDRIAFIAGGIGITPLRAMLETMRGNIVLLYRVMKEEDIVFRDELTKLAERRMFTVHYIVGDHRLPKNRWMMSADHLRQLVPDIAEREIYLCGPPAMVAAIESQVRHVGVPDQFIHVEKFALTQNREKP